MPRFPLLVLCALAACHDPDDSPPDASLPDGGADDLSAVNTDDFSVIPIGGTADLLSGDAAEVILERVVPQPIAQSIVVVSGVAAGSFDPARLRHFVRYAFPYVIAATGPGLQNIYATELLELVPGEQRLLYGGWDSADPTFYADRIFTATTTSFLSRPATDFSPPTFTGRALTISNAFTNGVPDWVANDPSFVVLYYPAANPTPHPFVLYSTAKQVTASGADDRIAWSITDHLALDAWFPADRPTPGTNFITVTLDAQTVNFMQRPSLVYDGTKFYLYYDQGGIANGPNGAADCAAGATVNDCGNIGFNIHVATATDGHTFTYQKKTMATFASAAEVERFNAGWIMFYDSIFDTIQYALSSDGITFSDHGPVKDKNGVQLKNPVGTITNTTVIRRGDRLLGLLYGEFPPLTDPRCAGTLYPVGGYCIDRGQVSAYFLQRKVAFDGIDSLGHPRHFEGTAAFDEDRVRLDTDLVAGESVDGTLSVYEPDETTLVLSAPITATLGMLYALK